jgi:glycine/D-amino acid oxidase-like deaminating enzyme
VYETTAAFALAQGHADSTGLDARVMGPEETRLLEPAVGDRIAGGVYFPDEAHCDRSRSSTPSPARPERPARPSRPTLPVKRLRRANGGIAVETGHGTFHAGTVVLAAGAWTSALAAPLGVFLPQEGGKGYHSTWPRSRRTPTSRSPSTRRT